MSIPLDAATPSASHARSSSESTVGIAAEAKTTATSTTTTTACSSGSQAESSGKHVESRKKQEDVMHHHSFGSSSSNCSSSSSGSMTGGGGGVIQSKKHQQDQEYNEQVALLHRHSSVLHTSQAAVAVAAGAQHQHQQQQQGSGGDQKLAAVVAAAEVAASMYDAYQAWALKTYGDSAKTKTVTKKKYNRIMKILRGEESSSVENSKFRFWVKAKGFRIAADVTLSSDPPSSREEVLYVPAVKTKADSGTKQGNSEELSLSCYKRVAVVENFYDIIYNVHVEMDGRSGKHAGQKRTYRAVAEMYAFLPREAVTRFLMSCSDCQKRMHLQYNNNNNNGSSNNNGEPSCHTNEDVGFNHKSKSLNAAAKINRLLISNSSNNNGMSPGSYTNGNESEVEDEEQDASPFPPASHLRMVMDENQMYTPRITQEIRKAVKKQSKAVNARNGLAAAGRANTVRHQIPGTGKRRGSPSKGTTGKSACKRMRLNSNNKIKQQQQHRQKDRETLITNDQDEEEIGLEVQWSELDEDARDDLEEEIEEEEMDVTESGCRSSEIVTTANDSCQEEEGEDDGEDEGEDEEEEEEAADGEGVEDGVEIDEPQVKDHPHTHEDDEEDENEETWVVGEGEEEDEELDDEEIRGIRAKMSSASPTSVSSSPELSCPSSSPASPLDMRKAGGSAGTCRTRTKAGGGGKARNRNLRNGMKSLHTSSSSPRLRASPASSATVTTTTTTAASSSSCSLQNGSSSTYSSGVKRNNCISKKSLSSAATAPSSSTSSLPASSSSLTTSVDASGKAIDLSPDSKIKTRDQIVAAFSALNGRNIRSCNNSNSISPRIGYNGHSSTTMMTLDDEDDDEDEEESDQMPGSKGESNGTYDPERLKAFNMFVRLFVDENLDRMVPISRQPKDKIQAIIDSCTRQFPEFSERSRKRIRTYLKSCRRTRRHKAPLLNESTPSPSPSTQSIAGVATTNASPDDPQQQQSLSKADDKISKSKELSSSAELSAATPASAAPASSSEPPASSPPPPPPPLPHTNSSSSTHEPLITCAQLSSTSSSYHLTSRLAEQILATACDNEFQNAQRVRRGLKPLYQESPASSRSSSSQYHQHQDHLSDAVSGDQHLLKSGGKNSHRYASSDTSIASTTIMSAAHHQQMNGLFPSSSSSSYDQHHHHPDQQQISAATPFPIGASSGAAVHILTPAVSAHTTSSSLLAALCQNRSPSDGLMADSAESNHITGGNATGGAMNGHKSGRGSSGSTTSSTKTILADLIENRSLSSSCAVAAAAAAVAAAAANTAAPSPAASSSPMHRLPASSPSSSSIPTTSYSNNHCTGQPQQLQRYILNPSEMAAVKQLISGYRESAAFLLRSADELEQLLLRQA